MTHGNPGCDGSRGTADQGSNAYAGDVHRDWGELEGTKVARE